MKYAKLWAIALLMFGSSAQAAIVSVAGPNSNLGTAASIIAAPAHVLDDIVFNTGMEGFNEAQGVVTSVAHGIDGGGTIAAGTRVDSHMIFLNSQGTGYLSHFGTRWVFSGTILGVMSDSGGTLEAASTFELGAPGTNYTATFGGSGPAAPFTARGLEGNGDFNVMDGYLISGNILSLGMEVTEPGDWIRVVTASVVPLPAAVWMFGAGLLGLLGFTRRKAAVR